jgi:hypothetical protein
MFFERREIELEENVRRKDLTPYEHSRQLVELAEQAAENLNAEFLATVARNSKRAEGRPQKADAETKIAERIGIPQQTIAI